MTDLGRQANLWLQLAWLRSGASSQVAGGDRRPSELLEALDGLCFYRVEDWWTYELCYKKAVRQFHKVRATEWGLSHNWLVALTQGPAAPGSAARA